MQNVQREIEQAAGTRKPVLIRGETGTGKDVVAREIHARSRRADKPFHPLNCGTLSPELADSALHGHAKGAFTGAEKARAGLIRTAHGGTLFLDEIGVLPFSVQAKLLRVFEDPLVRAVGEDATHAVDVRFIAATSADIESEIAKGVWRRDFFARFTWTIEVPPLRERLDDIEALALHFIQTERVEEGHNSRAERVSQRGLEHLCAYRWPMNVRELRQVIQRALRATALEGCEELDVRHLVLPTPKSRDSSSNLDALASDAVACLAASIVEELDRGIRAPETIDNIVKRFPQLLLGSKLAEAFYKKFANAAERDAKARALFGFSGIESVRRYLQARSKPAPEK